MNDHLVSSPVLLLLRDIRDFFTIEGYARPFDV